MKLPYLNTNQKDFVELMNYAMNMRMNFMGITITYGDTM